jgi:hypothetical protein
MAKKNEIQIIISAVDKASKELKGIGGALDKLGKVGLIAGGALVGIGAGIGVAAISLAKSAAPIEGIKNAFEGLTSTMEGGSKKILDSLEDASYGMVKQSDLMASFNSAAQLVSKDFAERMPDAMKYLSKVSAATGQDMGFMIDSMVKGVGRLSPMILDNLGIQVSLEEATANAAAAFGIEAGALSKAQIQTGMMNVVMEKLQTNTADMPDVAGSASQAMGQFQAQIGNLKEEIGLRLLPVFTEVLNGLNNWISSPEGQASIDKFMGWLSNVIGTADPPTGLTGIVTYLLSGNIPGAVDAAFGEGTYSKIASFVRKFEWELYKIKIKVENFKDKLLEVIGVWTTLSNLTGTPISKGGTLKPLSSIWGGGFASGGSFTVPGFGSGDRPYTMGLTPGEHVNVTPCGQSPAGGLALTVNINSPINLADRNYVERELMPYIASGVRQIMAGAG